MDIKPKCFVLKECFFFLYSCHRVVLHMIYFIRANIVVLLLIYTFILFYYKLCYECSLEMKKGLFRIYTNIIFLILSY